MSATGYRLRDTGYGIRLFPIPAMRYPIATEATPASLPTVSRITPRRLILSTPRKTDF
jgi:hypothetical protein